MPVAMSMNEAPARIGPPSRSPVIAIMPLKACSIKVVAGLRGERTVMAIAADRDMNQVGSDRPQPGVADAQPLATAGRKLSITTSLPPPAPPIFSCPRALLRFSVMPRLPRLTLR